MTDRARELLERVLSTNRCSCGKCKRVWEEIREYLASEKQDQPEPVAWTSQEQLGYMEDLRYEGCGMYMWKSPDNDLINIPLYLSPAPVVADSARTEEPVAILKHNGEFELLRMVGIPISQPMKLFENPAPQRSFVRLSEDEICEMANEAEVREWSDEIYNFARAIEDALEEKNK